MQWISVYKQLMKLSDFRSWLNKFNNFIHGNGIIHGLSTYGYPIKLSDFLNLCHEFKMLISKSNNKLPHVGDRSLCLIYFR